MNTKKKAEVKSMPLDFYYINLSSFHGDGKVVWMSKSGLVIVQIAEFNQPSSIYQLKLSSGEVADYSKKIESTDTNLKIVDRLGIPDEVRVSFGFRNSKKSLVSLQIWEKDWMKQSDQVIGLNQIAGELIGRAKQSKPVAIIPIPLKIYRPEAFNLTELKSILKDR